MELVVAPYDNDVTSSAGPSGAPGRSAVESSRGDTHAQVRACVGPWRMTTSTSSAMRRSWPYLGRPVRVAALSAAWSLASTACRRQTIRWSSARSEARWTSSSRGASSRLIRSPCGGAVAATRSWPKTDRSSMRSVTNRGARVGIGRLGRELVAKCSDLIDQLANHRRAHGLFTAETVGLVERRQTLLWESGRCSHAGNIRSIKCTVNSEPRRRSEMGESARRQR